MQWCRKACRKSVANIVANLSQRSTPLRHPVKQIVGFTRNDDHASIHHRLEVALKGTTVDLGA